MANLFNIQGIVVEKGAESKGNKNGKDWVRGSLVIRTAGEYPKTISFDFFGENRANEVRAVNINENVNIVFTVESRPYNGKWYTNANLYKLERAYAQQSQPMQQSGFAQPQPQQRPQPTQPAYVPPPTISSAATVSAEPAMQVDTTPDLPF